MAGKAGHSTGKSVLLYLSTAAAATVNDAGVKALLVDGNLIPNVSDIGDHGSSGNPVEYGLYGEENTPQDRRARDQ